MGFAAVRDTPPFLRNMPEENCLGDVARVDGSEFRYPDPPIPIIVKNWMRSWPAMKRWQPAYLKQVVGSRRVGALDLGSGGNVSGNFDTLIDAMTGPDPAKCYMPQIRIMWRSPNDDPWRGALADDVRLPDVVDPAAFQIANIWVASHAVTSSLHFDMADNFLAVVRGAKSLALFPPSQSRYLYPKFMPSRLPNFSRADLRKTNQFPRLRQGMYWRAVVEAGEMLYLPQFFWHQVYSECAAPGDLNIAANFWFNPSHQLPFSARRIPASIIKTHRALVRVYHSLPGRSRRT